MDPNQTWNDLSVAVEDGDWHHASELAEELMAWIDRGGFLPTITGKPAFDRIAIWQTCDAIRAWDVVT